MTWSYKPCKKITCSVCNSLSTSTTEICEETCKIQSGSLNCDSQKALYLLKYKLSGEAPYIGKAKTKF